jgi:hypothetical protein
MNWMGKDKNQLLFSTIVAGLLGVIALPLMWLKLPLWGVIGGLSLLAFPIWLVLYRGSKRMTYILLGLLGLAALCVFAMIINEWARVSTFEDACSKFNGSVLIEDLQYLCLNEDHETSVLSIDMLSGPINNGSTVVYGGVFLLSTLYSLYLLLHLLYMLLTKDRRLNR